MFTGVLALVGAVASGAAAGAATHGAVAADERSLRTGCHAFQCPNAVLPSIGDRVLETR